MKLFAFIIWQNVFFFLLDLVMVGLFSSYLVRKHADARMQKIAWRSPSTNAGVAMLTYFSGMAVVRGGLLIYRLGMATELPTVEEIPLFAGGTLVSIIGATCILRLFAEFAWRRWFSIWIVCVVVASIAAAVVALLLS